MTPDIFGRSSIGSFAKYDPESRCWRMFPATYLWGSPEFSGTWPKQGVMRTGVCIRQAPLELGTAATASGLWPTPVAHDTCNRNTRYAQGGTPLSLAVRLGTPTASMTRRSSEFAKGRTPNPAEFVAMMPTPQARDFRSGDKPDSKRANRKRRQGWSMGLNDFVLLPTPTVNGNHNRKGASKNSGDGLATAVRKMMPTPGAADCRDRGSLKDPCIQRRKAMGKQLNLGMVADPTSGQLNPMWVEWLMGFPTGWTDLNPSATPSCPNAPNGSDAG